MKARMLSVAALAMVPLTLQPGDRILPQRDGTIAFPGAGPWMLLASTNGQDWEFAGQARAGESIPWPVSNPVVFLKGAKLGPLAANTIAAPAQSPGPHIQGELPYLYFTSYASYVRTQTRRRCQVDAEWWDGGDVATYDFSESCGDLCPEGGHARFEYRPPAWKPLAVDRSDGCDWALAPSLGAAFSLWHIQAAVTNVSGCVTSTAVISHGCGMNIAGASNAPYVIEIGVRAMDWWQEPGNPEWLPLCITDPHELVLHGTRPHYVRDGWAVWRFLAVGGEDVDVTVPGKPGRYWSLEYFLNRYDQP